MNTHRQMNLQQSVTVVIPLYNHEKFIEKTIESVTSLSSEVDQIIVIDDGSKDLGYDKAMNQLREIQNSVFLTRENRGTASTLNEAISLAKTKWIAILNSDDLFLENKISRCLSILNDNSEIELIAGRTILIDDKDQEIKSGIAWDWYQDSLKIYSSNHRLEESLIQENFLVSTSNFFFSKKLWETMGGFVELRYCNDLEFALHACRVSKLHFDIEVPHFKYRIHSRNTIGESIYDIRLERCIVLTHHIMSMRTLKKSWFSRYRFEKRAKKSLQHLKFYTAFETLKVFHQQGQSFSEFNRVCNSLPVEIRPILSLDF
jgi:glycosyltransferase involved in cell wall biosynthesis